MSSTVGPSKPKREHLFATLLLAGLLPFGVGAQTSTWKEGYKQVIPSSSIDGLSADGIFGEQVNLYTGEVTFSVIDVSLKGNNSLDVSYRRKLDMTDQQITRGWVDDVPHLEGVYPENVGWTRLHPITGATGRCSSGAAAPPNAIGVSVGGSAATSVWDAGEYWSGDYLSLPGSGNEELLKVQTSGVKLPTGGTTYKWVTKSGWRISCITTAKNDSGEGFLALAPDGTKYYFDWFGSSEEIQVTRPGASGSALTGDGNESLVGGVGRTPSNSQQATGGGSTNAAAYPQDGLQRKRVLIFPSKVVDRFGNQVDYTYSGSAVASIVASDGRSITVSFGNPTTVTANGRTWTYSKDGTTGIYTVTLPDGSSWVYDLKAVLTKVFQYTEGGDGSLSSIDKACDNPPIAYSGGGTGTVKHPSGAIGTFTFSPVRHGRSYVDRNCIGQTIASGVFYSYPYRPYVFDTRSLTSKTISGPGLTSATWQYQYGPANNSWASSCGGGCVGTKYVDVIDPNGEKTRHIYSNRWQAAEGREIATEVYDTGATLRQRTDMSYFLTTAGQAYPAQIGSSGNARGDGSSARFDPLIESKITRDGRSFSWKVVNDCVVGGSATYCFDDLARPTKVVKTSAPSP